MRKEIVFAIIIGLILGFVILYGIKIANQSAQNSKNLISPSPAPDQQFPAIIPQSTNLEIISPENHSVINTDTVKLTGKSQPKQSIAIHSEDDDAIVISDDNGNFSYTVTLTGGENIISVTQLKSDETIETKTISIIYTTAKIN